MHVVYSAFLYHTVRRRPAGMQFSRLISAERLPKFLARHTLVSYRSHFGPALAPVRDTRPKQPATVNEHVTIFKPAAAESVARLCIYRTQSRTFPRRGAALLASACAGRPGRALGTRPNSHQLACIGTLPTLASVPTRGRPRPPPPPPPPPPRPAGHAGSVANSGGFVAHCSARPAPPVRMPGTPPFLGVLEIATQIRGYEIRRLYLPTHRTRGPDMMVDTCVSSCDGVYPAAGRLSQ
jgi:hypothetical protein